MLKDRYFYPIVMLLVGGMIYYALSFANHAESAPTDGYRVEGATLNTLFPAQGTNFSIAGDMQNPQAYAVLSANVARELAPPSAGVFVTLGPDYETAFAQKPLVIEVQARKGRSKASDRFDVGYFTADGSGDSGWHSFELTDTFKTYSFEFTPNLPLGEPAGDYVGIWPDVEGRNRTVDVKWVNVSIKDQSE